MSRMNEDFEPETRTRSRARFPLEVFETALEDIDYLVVMIEPFLVAPNERVKLVDDRIESSVHSVHAEVDPVEPSIDGVESGVHGVETSVHRVEASVHRRKPAVRPALQLC